VSSEEVFILPEAKSTSVPFTLVEDASCPGALDLGLMNMAFLPKSLQEHPTKAASLSPRDPSRTSPQ